MRKLLLLAGIMLPVMALCQKTITGKVFDASNNQPLVNASILVKGGRGVAAGNDGSFRLTIPANTKIVMVSYVGYESRSISVEGAETEFSVGLQPLLEQAQITVIGSRNLSRTKVQTPVPVDVIPISVMAKEVGQLDLNQMLTYSAPSFQSSRQAIADGTDHVDPAQLRGLGTDQVLVLVNGKRRHQSALVNVNGTVNRGQVGTDLNAIPIAAIERVEVLRDGAAAQYGSDAIAGVVNVVLKKSVNILSGSVSYGENISRYPRNYALGLLNNKSYGDVKVHDGSVFQASLNYGFSLAKKGYINLSGEYLLREKSNRAGTYTGQVYPKVNGNNRDDSIMNARGLTRDFFDMRIGNSRIAGGGLVLNASYPLGNTWNLKLFGGFSKKNGEAAGFYRYPSSIASGADIYASQVLGLYPNGFLPLIKSNIKDYSVSAGVEGKLGDWFASLSNTLGINTFDFTVDNSVNYTQYAVTPNGQTKFDAGGLKFLQNTINADMSRNFPVLQGLNVAYGAEFRVDQYGQRVSEEVSYKNYNTNSKAASGAQVFAGFVPAYANTHSRSNIGLYGDVELDITKNFMVEGALRFENYSDFGSTLNYKFATRYKVCDNFTLRAAASSGFRAPSMQQRFYAKTNTLFVGSTPTESGTFTNDSKPAEILGIPTLKEETSYNFSAGFTTTPVKGLEITVDGYIININNRIVLTNNFDGGSDTALARLLKENGAQRANFFTNAVDTRSKGLEAVASYRTTIGNANKLKFTLAATFIDNIVKKNADGTPAIKASPQLVSSGQIGRYFNREDQSRIEVANPHSKGNFTINYNRKAFSAMLRFSYFGKVTYLDPYDYPGGDPNNPATFKINAFTGQKESLDQEFSSKTITDLSLSYDLVKNLTLTIGANNIFDVYQDKHTHSENAAQGRFVYSRRVQQMGFNGRFVFARLSFSLAAR